MYRLYLFIIGLFVLYQPAGAVGAVPIDLPVAPTPAVTLDMKQVPLQDVLLEIEKQTGIFFSYNPSILKDCPLVSLTAREEPLYFCLKRLFADLPLVYRVTGQSIILKLKPRLYTISGFVRDSASFESLIGATVLERSGKGSISNNYGFYSITLPPGLTTLSSSYVGYNSYSTTFILTKDTLIDLPLKAANALNEVIVSAINPRTEVLNSRIGVSDVPAARIKSLPALLGEADVVKTLQRQPGAAVGTEGMSGLYVRGGNGDENLYLLDGNPVYHTSHLLGFFSAFNPDAVKNATFYKGSFPAEYGGRLSSVIDVRTNDGDRKEYHGNISVGLLAVRANLEGPLVRDRSSFNVSVRRTWMELITWPLLMAANRGASTRIKGGYHFYDMNAKVNHSFSDRSRVYLSFYMGSDSYLDGRDSDELYGINKRFRWRWGNLIGSGGWNYMINNKLFATFTAGYTRYRSHIMQEQDAFVSSVNEQNPQLYYQEGHYRSAMEDVSLRASFDFRPNVNHRIRMGGDYLFHNFRPEQTNMRSWYRDSVVTQNTNTVFAHSLIHGHEVSLFAEDEMHLTDRLSANVGLRYTLFNVQQRTYQSFQPRLSSRFLLLKNLSAKVSYTKMNQYIHLLSNSYINQPTDIWVPVTDRIRPMNAHQVSAGLFYHWNGFDFSAEGYYKRMNNLVEYADNIPALSSFTDWEDRVGLGKGRSYGLELMAQKKVGRLTGWIGYTLSWSDRWFPDGSVNKGLRYPSKYDNRHKIDIAGTYKLSRKVELTAAWMYASGNHITIMDQLYRPATDQAGHGYFEGMYIPYGNSASSRNNYQLTPYHRLDIGANFYRYKKKGRMGIWNLSLCNVYMKPNAFMVSPQYESTDGADGKRRVILRETILFRFLPSLSYTYKF